MSTFAYPPRTKKPKTVVATTSKASDLNSTQNLVDPEWEFIDPTPNVHLLFGTFNGKFFAGKLSCVELEWSTKMYQCAGICYSRRNRLGMSITIRLSEPLLKLRSRKDLVETLLHEMIHAWNFVRGIMEENGGHGQNFLAKMHEINRSAGTNISVYHSFRDEVELYKIHWWRCDGPCQKRQPFYGFVKRTSNRAPGPNDRWWTQHQNSCSGKFIKVKEPEKPEKTEKEKKTRKPSEKSKKLTPTTPSNDIRKFFKPTSPIAIDTPKKPVIESKIPVKVPSFDQNGKTLGGTGSGRSKLLDMFAPKVPPKRKLESPPRDNKPIVIASPDVPMTPGYKSYRDSILAEFEDDNDDDIVLIDDEFDDSFPKPIMISSPEVVIVSEIPTPSTSRQLPPTKCHCPVCNAEMEVDKINEHLDQCLGC